ncbi:hypothetical protein ACIBBD_38435 [Streptomyces sp. NPDC051315]|uniref:hypothetical protein n=1 Tax=Streptomyces sp. NPDC051315 TaxID=3365650 RepID=UPI00378EC8DB
MTLAELLTERSPGYEPPRVPARAAPALVAAAEAVRHGGPSAVRLLLVLGPPGR